MKLANFTVVKKPALYHLIISKHGKINFGNKSCKFQYIKFIEGIEGLAFKYDNWDYFTLFTSPNAILKVQL